MIHVTIYSGSHLPIEVILRLIHMWSVKTSVKKAQDDIKFNMHIAKMQLFGAYCILQISSAITVDWYNFVHDICAEYI